MTESRHSECRKLVRDVSTLSNKLGRPVSSKDLTHWYRGFPEERPLLTQAIGQLLIKASQRRGILAKPIHRIGLFRNLAYYAPESGEIWNIAFTLFILQERAREAVKVAMPHYATILIGTDYEEFSRNALRGFYNEWFPQLAGLAASNWPHLDSLKEIVGVSDRLGSDRFVAREPRDFCSREDARNLLMHEMQTRRPDYQAQQTNLNRHLSILKWPMSALFSQRQMEFVVIMIRNYCAMKWPVFTEESMLSGAVFRCLAYGIPKGGHQGVNPALAPDRNG